MNFIPPAPAADPYLEFLLAKAALPPEGGFPCDEWEVHPLLKPHQRACVAWAVRGGQRALFQSFGLGKTLQQLEIVRLILEKLGTFPCRGLIICPLGVKQEFARDAAMIGLTVTFVRRSEEITGNGIYLTNYESVRDGRLDPALFDVASLDEADCLRSYGSKTFHTFLTLFQEVPYRFVATATPSPNKVKEIIHYAGFLGIMDTGQSLAQPLDAKVLTPTGWKEMGDIGLGQNVIALDGKPATVIGIYPQGEKDIYRVSFSDGSSAECTEEHLWLTRTQYERNNEARYRRRNGPDAFRCGKFASVKTTTEIAKTLVCGPTGSKNHQIPLVDSVDFEARSVSVNPYLMGILLGDGHLRTTSVMFSSADPYIIGAVREIASSDYGLEVNQVEVIRSDGRPCYDFIISSGKGKGSGGGRGHFSNQLLNTLKSYGLLESRAWNKRIPTDYLFNTAAVRLGVLQGLMDADGSIDNANRTTHFLTTCPGLAEDVQFLVRSFGGVAVIREHAPSGGGMIAGRLVQGKLDQYHVSINLPAGINPFRLPRKADLVIIREKYKPVRYITGVEYVGTKQAQCIAVDHPNHLYVTDDFIVTHNTRFFQRDSTQANNLTLYPHKEAEFWLWVSSWAVFLTRPSDLGFPDTGYDLPPLEIIFHELPATTVFGSTETNGQTTIMTDSALSLPMAAREKRDSLSARIDEMLRIMETEDPDTHWLLWHTLESERHAIEKAVPGVRTAYGSQDMDAREAAVMGFASGAVKDLATKPSIAGAGTNLQKFCHNAIFLGADYKNRDFMQAAHRICRFGQVHPCRIHLIHTEAERQVVKTLMQKWETHKQMQEKMSALIKEHGLGSAGNLEGLLQRSIGVERVEVTSRAQMCGKPLWRAVNNDAILEARRLETGSVDLIVTSIPFATHYEYTPSYNDLGHTDSNGHFWQQMDFLTPELLRALSPGRLACIHVKDRINFGNVTGKGYPTVSPFHMEAAMHFMGHGFEYMGMITVVTDVVRENNQTYRLGYTEMRKDGTKMGCGSPEYVLLLRAPQSDRGKGYADRPVVKSKDEYSLARWQVDAHAFWRSSGNRQLTAEEMAGYGPGTLSKMYTEFSLDSVYDYEFHAQIGEELLTKGALPSSFMSLAPGSHDEMVWTDINRMRTLNGSQVVRGKEMHICPLQFDIVDRLIGRYSSKGDLIYDPFLGLGTVAVQAVKAGRRGGGSELNAAYFRDSLDYLRAEEERLSMPTLFDFEEMGADAADTREAVAA